jgi:hypothetical protein
MNQTPFVLKHIRRFIQLQRDGKGSSRSTSQRPERDYNPPSRPDALLLIKCCPELQLLSLFSARSDPQIAFAKSATALFYFVPPGLVDLVLQIFNPARLLPTVIATMGSELGLTAESMPRPRMDKVGIFFICWTTTWTLMLLGGMGFLIRHRQMSMLKVRGIWLSLSSILFLHLYWASVQLGYVLGPLYPDNLEFWIMSIYLPLGIGLFHASNTRFLHVAQRQKQFIDKIDNPNAPTLYKSSKVDGILGRFRQLDYSAKAVVLVSAGMFFQVSRHPYSWSSVLSLGHHELTTFLTAIHGNLHVPHLPQMA